MKAEDIRRVLVVGGGTMGQQIALQFALHGCDVAIYDLNDALLERARTRIGKLVRFVAQHQRIPPERAEGVMDRIAMTTDPEEASAGVNLVSESVPEDPELKGRVLGMFDALCPPEAIFTTNTSTLLPSMFAAATDRPERFLAFHFHDLRANTVVDVMPHPGTDPATTALVRAFAERMGLIPIVLKKENFGYVFNAMLTTLFQSAQTLAANEVAGVEDIDRAWMGVMGMFIGPFGIMDSVGLDTVWHITDYWAKKTRDPQSLKNAAFLKPYVDRGELGQKSGQGFYAYPKPAFTRPGFVAGRPDTENPPEEAP
jgi:3-hydroxybutyryl-CoA dehydrogenase